MGAMVLCGDVMNMLASMKEHSIQCVVTSPPYWGLRDYKVDGQIGLEPTPEAYVEKMVAVFREVRRVLRKDGTLWLNLGDSYAQEGGRTPGQPRHWDDREKNFDSDAVHARSMASEIGLKPKDLVGIPWRVAFALQADGWWLRSDIIWSKPNPMPESVTDRPTKAHEYLFLLTKSAKYYYDAEAIKEDGNLASIKRLSQPTFTQQTGGPKDPLNSNRSCRKALENLKRSATPRNDGARWNENDGRGFIPKDKQRGHGRRHDGFNDRWDGMTKKEQCDRRVNKRTVWTIATQPYPEAHFATFPPKLIEPCILAGSKVGDVVLDPFAGSGTTLAVAERFGRKAVGIELNPVYVALANERLNGQPLALPFWRE